MNNDHFKATLIFLAVRALEMTDEAARKGHTHALLVDFSITSLEEAQDDLLGSLGLVSAQALPFSDLEKIVPAFVKEAAKYVEGSTASIAIFGRIVQGLSEEHEEGGPSCILIFSAGTWPEAGLAEPDVDSSALFLRERERYDAVSPFHFS